MPWTATAGPSPVQGDSVITVVHLDNGAGKQFDIQVVNDGTLTNLQAQTRQRLLALNGTGVRQVVAPGTVLDLSAPVPPQPTQADLDRATWAAAYMKVNAYRRSIANGLTASG